MISKKRKRKKKTQYLFLKNRLLSRMGMKLGEKKNLCKTSGFLKDKWINFAVYLFPI